MVQTVKKQLPKCLIELTIEVEDSMVQDATDEATKNLAKESKIPGFRPGKAPKHIIEKNFGKAAIFQKALDELLPKIYSESIQLESIEPIGQPEINIKSTEPLIVEATIPTKPIIDLGEYKKYRVKEPKMPEIEPLVQQSIDTLQRQYGTLEPVDRPIEWGDSVRIDFNLKISGIDQDQSEEDAEFIMDKNAKSSLPGFLDKLVGKKRNDSYKFSITIPKDFEVKELSSKKANYDVKIKEIKKSILPELNDEFVQTLDPQLKTVKDLKEKLHLDVAAKLESDQKTAYREEIIDFFVTKSDIEYPELLVQREIERIIDQQSNHASHTPQGFEKWLKSIGQSETEVHDALKPNAEIAVKRSLVLSEVINIEKINATTEAIEQEVNKIKLDPSYSLSPEKAKLDELINSDDFVDSLKNQILTNKAWETLEIIAAGKKQNKNADKLKIDKQSQSKTETNIKNKKQAKNK
jgi:trigger factor